MRVLPAFGGLLVALQLVAAVHLDQLDSVRFAKVRRTVSGPSKGDLKRRAIEQIVPGVRELVEKFEGQTGAKSQAEFVAQLKQLVQGSDQAASPKGKEVMNHYQTGSSSAPSLTFTHPAEGEALVNPRFAEHDNLLNKHVKALDDQAHTLNVHEQVLLKSMEGLDTLNGRLSAVEASKEKLLEAQKKSNRGLKWGVGTALGTATLAGGASALYAQGSKDHINALSDTVAQQQAEIEKLKAASAGRASTGAGIQAGASTSGGLV
ncbi:hypothetical protein PaG_02237 [Moesziomyces aphidis]|uniref:Uncharacterized protein n=1 Tax=Moesziomyces aphidis TaxID=84754 RepID=W3VSZ1_MOEAP|nr:hypothetical protein PaG_02237 [Moesziomyces aphidis]